MDGRSKLSRLGSSGAGLGSRPGAPWFSRAELDQQFPYLDAAKLDNLIARLRVNGILAWDSETSRYSISPLGRMLIAAVSSLLKFGDDGSELGYLAGQLAAGGAIGGLKVSTESAWFAARPSGTEDKYKIYAESMRGEDHLREVQEQAQSLVDGVLAG